MNDSPNVVIVLAKCQHSHETFGIRIEELSPSQWVANWAFAIQENKARKEGYDRGQIRGSFEIASAYPGCPHCKQGGFFKCGCGKVSCWDGSKLEVTCPWCGSSGTLSGAMDSLNVNGDR